MKTYTYYTVAGISYPVASMGVKPTSIPSFEKWDTCPVCGFDFPLSKFKKWNGKLFCVPNGCHRDIPQLARKEGRRRT
jgi:hypothetical protein